MSLSKVYRPLDSQLQDGQPHRDQCGLCRGSLRHPRLLPCGHSFCQLCLEKHYSANCPWGTVICSVDGSRHRLPPNGIQGLPVRQQFGHNVPWKRNPQAMTTYHQPAPRPVYHSSNQSRDNSLRCYDDHRKNYDSCHNHNRNNCNCNNVTRSHRNPGYTQQCGHAHVPQRSQQNPRQANQCANPHVTTHVTALNPQNNGQCGLKGHQSNSLEVSTHTVVTINQSNSSKSHNCMSQQCNPPNNCQAGFCHDSRQLSCEGCVDKYPVPDCQPLYEDAPGCDHMMGGQRKRFRGVHSNVNQSLGNNYGGHGRLLSAGPRRIMPPAGFHDGQERPMTAGGRKMTRGVHGRWMSSGDIQANYEEDETIEICEHEMKPRYPWLQMSDTMYCTKCGLTQYSKRQ